MRDYENLRARLVVKRDFPRREFSGHVSISKHNKGWRGPIRLNAVDGLDESIMVFTCIDQETGYIFCRIKPQNTGTGGEITVPIETPPREKTQRTGWSGNWKATVFRLRHQKK